MPVSSKFRVFSSKPRPMFLHEHLQMALATYFAILKLVYVPSCLVEVGQTKKLFVQEHPMSCMPELGLEC